MIVNSIDVVDRLLANHTVAHGYAIMQFVTCAGRIVEHIKQFFIFICLCIVYYGNKESICLLGRSFE